MKETIKRIIARTHKSHDMAYIGKGWLTEVLTEELSTLNPMKIDEERMKECFEQVFTKDIYLKSHFKTIVDQYNSTIEDHQVFQPLPSEMPSWFARLFNWASPEDSRKIWSEIINHYGTPTKKELVSVEELAKEIKNIYVPCSEEKKLSYVIAQHLVNKYGLNPPNRDEFPFNLKKGDKFMWNGKIYLFEKLGLIGEGCGYVDFDHCTPYTEPSIHDKFMASLSDEQKKMYEEIKEATK